jgi:hypothetical protein
LSLEINYIVSGLPRSGTSLVMQMLKNGGMRIATDHKRKPDEDNPKGYLEIDGMLNKIKKDPNCIFNYTNRVVKIIAYGLQYLPEGNYKIIYIERNIEEVLDSMEKMAQIEDNERDQTRDSFILLNNFIKAKMKGRWDVRFLIINYNELIKNPIKVITNIEMFLDMPELDKMAMIETVDNKLYRNRK